MTYYAPTPTPETAALLADYPDLKLSFGYIGNIGGAPVRDDRRFYVFTQVRSEDGRSSQGVPAMDIPAGTVGVYNGPVIYDTPAVRQGLDRLRAKVETRALRMWREGE